MFELNNFDSIQIGIASPEKIRGWSYGEVTKPETINYRTQKPERDGLFCERIFGPTKDWECHCGKYKRIRYKGVICDKCGVEVTRAKVRRERMGHIELAAPVSHIWYFRGVPSRIGLILDMGPKQLEQVLYFAGVVVLDPGTTDFAYKQVISDTEYSEAVEKYGADALKVGTGAEAIKELLMAVDLDKEAEECREIVEKSSSSQKKLKAVKRLDIIEAFRKSGNRPEWMILDVLPVIPPELRPMVALEGGRFAASDLNELYRRVVSRNNRLKRLLELGVPDIMIRNEKRMLQEAVDALIDNGRRGKAFSGAGNRDLKSLSGMLKGKQGRFRQNLLGKRVDYSGRSVIVVGPELKLYQCGLPKEMAIELFKPFVMKRLIENGYSHNIKSAKRTVERMKPVVWDILEEVIKDHPVLLNRAPTLHRLSIQAFEPVLIDGRAIKLHPLVCGAFNADFDGDQMAVHVPLSIEAQAEARFLMLSSNNILKLADGKPVLSPSQDMILGCYYLTILRRAHGKKYDETFTENEAGVEYKGGIYTADEAIVAYQTKQIHLQDEIFVRRTVVTPEGKEITGIIKTTPGRVIFNEAIPQNLGICKREKEEDYLLLEVNDEVVKGTFKKIIGNCFKVNGAPQTAETLDNIKALGFKYSTISGLTTSVFDMKIPGEKKELIETASKDVAEINNYAALGLLTEDERHRRVIAVWEAVEKKIGQILPHTLDKFNPIAMMMDSGARGNQSQLQQLIAMRGLMKDPSGRTIEIPVKSSFREGLSVLEYFVSSHGGRKGLADTALKTADSGYLTRRLVDVSHNVIVREDDCFESLGEKPKGMMISAILDEKGKEIESLEDRLVGRWTIDAVCHPKTGEVIVPADTMISEEQAKAVVKAGITQVLIRSIFTCKSKNGVCVKCYGKNMSNMLPVNIGESVGIIAAQSIGEPGTQLTMRTFHSGGVASAGDITQGLPRIEELFESRRPKGQAIVCETSGVVTIEERDGVPHVIVQSDDVLAKDAVKDYLIPFGSVLLVKEGDIVAPGDVLTGGSVYPQDILRTKGPKGVQDYILREVQSVYRSQGVDINDKHIEIIVRQMLRKVRVEDCGDTSMLPGELVDIIRSDEENLKAMENGKRPATVKRMLLGITKASLATESFLSAASFQETARVLTEAAIKNKVDPLVGLKENVIIGKLIPAGTGVKDYKQLNPQVINNI